MGNQTLTINLSFLVKNLTSIMPCHVLKVRFVHQRYDKVRDKFGKLLNEVCNNVEIESPLLPLIGENLTQNSNKSDEARLDVRARGFWQRGQRAFFDVRIFNPYTRSKTP